MSVQPSNRIIREQFSEGTTIDSDRIQGALDTVEARINEIPRGDILPRYVEKTMHLGFLPSGIGSPYPWGPLYNLPSFVTAAGTDKVANSLRVKGCYNGNIGSPSAVDPFTGRTRQQYVWSTGVQYPRPCIISGLHFSMVGDTEHSFYGLIGSDANHVLVSVDSDSDGGDRHLNSFEVVKHHFSDDSWLFRRGQSLLPAGDATVDMQPEHPDNLVGLFVSFSNMGVAVPAGARVRYQLVIPESVNSWPIDPYSTLISGLTVHYLEEVVK
tara:strand:+ start:1543 stop:2349 length:807 start_codon:yes stop_codon:yes gene_type:complete